MELLRKATKFLTTTAVHCKGRDFTYENLLGNSSEIREILLKGRKNLEGERVVFLAPQTYEFIPVQWGIWQAGGIAVPLCIQHPPPEWEYVLSDTEASVVICHSSFASQLVPLAEKKNIRVVVYSDFFPKNSQISEVPYIDGNRGAQIIYTSGTTGRPKGVVTSHNAISAQVNSLVQAWDWSEKDHILEVLPLHHVHGNVNVVSCALASGAQLTFHSKFEAAEVWKEFSNSKSLNLFMGVPTIYSKLIKYWKDLQEHDRKKLTETCKKFRLMVSGSMALPEFVLNQWTDISKQILLERYGMTECGMILSNPLKWKRKVGYVGSPLPGVEVKIVDSEVRVKSAGMFTEYFKRPEDTLSAFDSEGWFRTGDFAEKDLENSYKILGRASVDILKSGGFKISALDIENDLLAHPDIEEVAVVGLPDPDYGQTIAAIIKANRNLPLEDLKNWAIPRMAPYKIPRVLLQVAEIPRNQMGKVNKKELSKLF